jgi:phytoene dehydrogenase-like protein
VKDERLAQMLDHFVQYVGSSPYGAPAVLCAIAHMQAADGVWYPMGGTRAVAEGLMKLATELGVTFKPQSDVGSLKIESGKVTGLTLADGTAAAYDNVISNMDSVRTYRELVGGEVGEHYARKDFEPACSGVVLYLGLKKRYDHLLHHDFVFSRDPHEEFDAIYRPRRAGAGSDLLHRGPVFDRSERGAGGWRSALRARAHAVSAPASRLVADVACLSPGDPRQAEAHRRHGRHRGSHRGGASPHAAGHP